VMLEYMDGSETIQLLEEPVSIVEQVDRKIVLCVTRTQRVLLINMENMEQTELYTAGEGRIMGVSGKNDRVYIVEEDQVKCMDLETGEITDLVTAPFARYVRPLNEEQTYLQIVGEFSREYVYEVETDTLYELFGDFALDGFCTAFGLW